MESRDKILLFDKNYCSYINKVVFAVCQKPWDSNYSSRGSGQMSLTRLHELKKMLLRQATNTHHGGASILLWENFKFNRKRNGRRLIQWNPGKKVIRGCK